jgi:2-succinyl-5-enolpyruvyl-6-hydroxy-3-cyclohexene-1-carboxylate synthase
LILPSIVNIAQICASHAVKHIVLSPGSRCAPLILAFVRHPKIVTYTISDERSAGFIALGMARQLQQPVGLVCTSGSAAYNYAPAIAEAYFQQIPLLVFTADRPPEWTDQLDGQTIRQHNIYGQHVKRSFEFPAEQNHPDVLWHAARIISEAINLSTTYPYGPVHINVPIREPFYPEKDETIIFDSNIKVIRKKEGKRVLSGETLVELKQAWNGFQKKLIVCGQYPLYAEICNLLAQLSENQKIPVVADVISNQHPVKSAIRYADVMLSGKNFANPEREAPHRSDPYLQQHKSGLTGAQKDEVLLQKLQPDLLITFGLSVISKNLKLFLRKYRPKTHWHIQPAGEVADPFQSLTEIIRVAPEVFFKESLHFAKEAPQQESYFQTWQQEMQKAENFIKDFFEKPEILAQPGEFLAMEQVMRQIPGHASLHLANSMAVRYANLIGLQDHQKNIEVVANRGTSGIDGSNSTAVGSTLVSDKLTVLLTGDMAFFYDRNAFWHNYPLPNLRIVVLNNHAGGIFRIIDGPSRQPELEEYFETRQMLNAENTARDFDMEYHHCDMKKPNGLDELKSVFGVFFRKSERTKILEITSDSKTNQQIFNQYKNLIKQGYGA